MQKAFVDFCCSIPSGWNTTLGMSQVIFSETLEWCCIFGSMMTVVCASCLFASGWLRLGIGSNRRMMYINVYRYYYRCLMVSLFGDILIFIKKTSHNCGHITHQ